MRLLLLSLALVAVCSARGGIGVASGPLLPGDAAPALPVKNWLQRGAFDTVRPVKGRLITVIVFFASWDPLSRTVLPIIDARQAEMAAQGVRFVMVSEESPEAVRAYLAQAKLKNLAVACEAGQALLGAFVDLRGQVLVPHAVVLAGTPDTLLWHGPVVVPDDKEGPTAAFERTLREAVEGRYNVAAAREVEVGIRELDGLEEKLVALAREGKLDELRAATVSVRQRDWPARCEDSLAGALAWPAYFLVGQGQPDRDKAALGLELIDEALAVLDRVGERDASLLHVRALALFAQGDVKGAIASEQAALAVPDISGYLADQARALVAQWSAPPGASRAPAAPPAPARDVEEVSPVAVSSREAVEDLEALHARLRTTYSAYDDSDWALRAAGSSWEQRTADLRKRLQARPEWPTGEFCDLLLEYFAVTGDRHFTVIGRLPSAQGVQRRWERPAPRLTAFFTDIRIGREGGRYRVLDTPADLGRLRGAEPLEAAAIDSPLTARGGRAYLFPTLPRGKGAQEYLLGVLADPRAAPSHISVVMTSAGGREEVTLPVHRSRAASQGNGSVAWQVEMQPLPRLSVRTMDPDQTTDLPSSAIALRAHPAALLDLRGNGGGGDPIVRDWCALFTDQRLRMVDGWCEIRPGEVDPRRRWNSYLNGAQQEEPRSIAGADTTPRYRGRLFILADNGTGSAAESFVCLAGQIEGAVLVGENTAGCDMYGNRDQSFTLPHSRLQLSYSRSKSVEHGRPLREGVGYFPDYWLDTEDPVGAVVEYLKLR